MLQRGRDPRPAPGNLHHRQIDALLSDTAHPFNGRAVALNLPSLIVHGIRAVAPQLNSFMGQSAMSSQYSITIYCS